MQSVHLKTFLTFGFRSVQYVTGFHPDSCQFILTVELPNNILHFYILNHAKMSKHLMYPMEWDIIIHPSNSQIQGLEMKTHLKFLYF